MSAWSSPAATSTPGSWPKFCPANWPARGRLARIRVEVKDRPGQLADITRIIAECGGNIVEVSHQRVFTRLPAKGAYAMFEVETRDRIHLNHLISEIKAAGYTVQLLEID